MIFVNHVESNLKRGCDLALGQRTVLVGRNGLGKSTVLQSIELALRGMASDVEGRKDVKQPRALGRLFPEGVEPSIRVRLSNDTACTWKMVRKDGTCKEPTRNVPTEFEWPIQDLQALLSGEATSIAAWLEKRVSGGMTIESLLNSMPPEVRQEVTAIQKKLKTTDLIALSKAAKDEAKALKANATRAEKTVEQTTQGINSPMSDEAKATLQSRLSELEGTVRGGVTQSEYDRRRADLDSLVEAFVAARDALQQIQPVPDGVQAGLTRLQAMLQLSRLHEQHLGMERCLVCAVGGTNDLHGHRAQVEQGLSLLKDHFGTATKNAALQQAYDQSHNRLRTAAEAFKVLVVAPDHTAEMNEIRGKLAADVATRRMWDNVAATRKEAAQLQARAEHLSTAGKALAKAGKEMVSERKRQFEETVSSFLPPGEVFSLDVDTGRVGLKDGESFHSAVSGAEWTRILLALASVEERKCPSILAPEDRAWDDETLTRVMVALKNSPHQVILMSTVRPQDVDGWTIVEL
jgi:energy-coupling factor transporter ATP-binding protein EcfA2